MVLAHLTDAERYFSLHPGFPAAFAYLRQLDVATLQPGRYEIDGARLRAIVEHTTGRTRAGAKLETHARYIDIQFVAAGADEFGWQDAATCAAPLPYNAEKDLTFYADVPDIWVPLPAGTFALFFPADAHAPLAGSGEMLKVVVKVAIDW